MELCSFSYFAAAVIVCQEGRELNESYYDELSDDNNDEPDDPYNIN